MNETIQIILLISNLLLIALVIRGHVKMRQAENGKHTVNVQYFEYIEDNSGMLKDSKRFVVKGQLFVDGLPVGQQFVVCEHTIEKFDYEKLKQLKSEIVIPVLKGGFDAAMAFKSGGASAISSVASAAKNLRSKAG